MEAKRGRPSGSQVRRNIAEILYFAKKAYGYELYKHYCELFPKVTLRLIYYHLRKGVAAGEFEIKEVKKEDGDYSWGPSAEKIYYTLGKNAKPIIVQKVATYFDKVKKAS
jgi:hypothetical protein